MVVANGTRSLTSAFFFVFRRNVASWDFRGADPIYQHFEWIHPKGVGKGEGGITLGHLRTVRSRRVVRVPGSGATAALSRTGAGVDDVPGRRRRRASTSRARFRPTRRQRQSDDTVRPCGETAACGGATAALSRTGAGVDVPPHAAAAAVTSDNTVRPGIAGQVGRFPLAKLSIRLDR